MQALWNPFKFKNISVYKKGNIKVENKWVTYPKLIFTLKSKGKVFGVKEASHTVSSGEVMLGPTVVEPKQGDDKNDQELVVPLLTTDGLVQGQLTVKIKFQRVKAQRVTKR